MRLINQTIKLFNTFIGNLDIIFTVAAIVFLNGTISNAQQPNQWSPQARIPVYDDRVGEQPPHLISAPNGIVYAFNAQATDTGQVIMYREWTQERGWTEPNDIFVANSGGSIEVLDIFLDHNDVAHIALAMDGDLFYSKTLLATAHDASQWLSPVMLGSQMTGPLSGGIVGDVQGNLIIIFGSKSDANGMYWLNSTDGGETWSEVSPLFSTFTNDIWVMGARVYAGERMHAVWNTINQAGHGDAVYYANFDFENKEWSDVVTLATKSKGGVVGLGTLFPTVTEYNGTIIVSYYSGNVNGNWWRLSKDGGQTWTEPVRISPRHVGTNGAVSFVIDGGNSLHAFFGQRINDQNHGMWHIRWTGFGWTEALPVVSGPQVRDVIGGNGFDPRSAGAAISQGNEVLVTWATDGIAGENGAWFSYSVLNAPKLITRSLTIPANTALPTADKSPVSTVPLTTITATITPRSTKPAVLSDANKKISSNKSLSNSLTPLVIGLVPIILIISVIIAYQFYTHSSRR